MTPATEEVEFRGVFAQLAALYPSFQPKEFSAQSYWGYLKDLPPQCIRRAAVKLPSEHPEFFPSAQQWRQLAERIKQSQDARATAGARRHLPPHRPVHGRAVGKFELLARKWEQESRELGLVPNERTHPEIHRRRMREFWHAWKNKGETHGQHDQEQF